eukprot:GHVS01065456.1.p1 GENE.GHVS01065456.1~~GHVS01065456.1.p1  ORF type:complete len:129 (+),score=20.85 GHVS01065456.1:26-412(+)
MATSDLGLKGFPVCVWNRSPNKVQDTIRRAEEEGLKDNLPGYTNLNEFVKKNRRSCFCVIFLFPQVNAISKPRKIILLIQAGAAVDAAIDQVLPLLTPGDMLIDGGNEWFANTSRRAQAMEVKGICPD